MSDHELTPGVHGAAGRRKFSFGYQGRRFTIVECETRQHTGWTVWHKGTPLFHLPHAENRVELVAAIHAKLDGWTHFPEVGDER